MTPRQVRDKCVAVVQAAMDGRRSITDAVIESNSQYYDLGRFDGLVHAMMLIQGIEWPEPQVTFTNDPLMFEPL